MTTIVGRVPNSVLPQAERNEKPDTFRMKTLRRYKIENADYFIVVVTHNRRDILLRDIDLFWACWKSVKPYAWVIMPDHFHVMISTRDTNISTLMHNFKITYSRNFRNKFGPGRVWQNRFWDHIIRDQQDLNNHLNYIHYNPAKHGMVTDPFLYEHSSLQKYAEMGYYSRSWGVSEEMKFEGDFGE